MKKKICKECGRIIPHPNLKRNKDDELPYEIKLELSKENIKDIRKGNIPIWMITDKRKLGYCEVSIIKAQKSTTTSKRKGA